jgi:hypothetical protein
MAHSLSCQRGAALSLLRFVQFDLLHHLGLITAEQEHEEAAVPSGVEHSNAVVAVVAVRWRMDDAVAVARRHLVAIKNCGRRRRELEAGLDSLPPRRPWRGIGSTQLTIKMSDQQTATFFVTQRCLAH